MSNKNLTSVSSRVAARLPLDLVAWIDAQPGTRTEVVERALMAARAAAKPTTNVTLPSVAPPISDSSRSENVTPRFKRSAKV